MRRFIVRRVTLPIMLIYISNCLMIIDETTFGNRVKKVACHQWLYITIP